MALTRMETATTNITKPAIRIWGESRGGGVPAAHMTGNATDKKAAEGEKVDDAKLEQLAKEVEEKRKA